MDKRGVIAFAAGQRFGAAEHFLRRHLDTIGGERVKGPVAAVLDARARRSHERIGACDAGDRTERLRHWVQGVTLDLRRVEHPRCAGDTRFAVVIRNVGIGLGVELLVEDHRARFHACANLSAKLRPLFVSGPHGRELNPFNWARPRDSRY